MNERLKAWVYRLAVLALVSVLAMGLAYTFPADLALLMAGDIAFYLEAVVTVWAVAQVARIKPMWAATRIWLSAIYARVRGRTSLHIRSHDRPERKQPANDDEGPIALAA